jgi:cold shock CspA family protein
MTGTIKSFLSTKGYGFIVGDDTKTYFFKREWIENEPIDGLRVDFDGEPSPKGYCAKRIKIVSQNTSEYFMLPDSFITSKSSTIAGYEIIDYPNWYIQSSTSRSKESPDQARQDLISRAADLGANAIINLTYSKGTGSEAGTGKGTHYFTTHHFQGIPTIIGKRHANGITVKKIINDNAIRTKEYLSKMTKASSEKSITIRLVSFFIALGAYAVKAD